MSKLRLTIPLLVTLPLLAACGGRITVQVLAEGAEAEPAEDLEVQFLPFDRDSLFAVMASQAPAPEPEIPADLTEATDRERELRDTWSVAEANWNNVRDSMRTINARLESLDRRTNDYRNLFQVFGDMETREEALDRRRQSAFDTFNDLQLANQQRVDSICIVIDSWEEVTFAGYGDVEGDLLAALGRGIAADTTDVDGVASTSAPGGPWWVHARLKDAAGELYWNVVVEGASSDTLRLRRENAELRQGVRQRC